MVRVRYHIKQPYTIARVTNLIVTMKQDEAVFLTDRNGVEHELALTISDDSWLSALEYHFTPIDCHGRSHDVWSGDKYEDIIKHLRAGGSGIARMTLDEMVESIVSMNWSVA